MSQNVYTGYPWLDSIIDQHPELIAAHEYGIDVAALVANAERSVEERILRHGYALQMYKMLRDANKE